MQLASPLRVRFFRLAIVSVFIGGALAGCIGSPDQSGATEKIKPSNTSEFNTTSPRGEIAAFKETNATESEGIGAMEHEHDYWLGQDRRVIFEDTQWLIPFPLLPAGAPAGTAIADFHPTPPNLVFEGTGTIEVVVKDVFVAPLAFNTDAGPVDANLVPHPHANFHLAYLTANDPPGNWHDAGPVSLGKPVSITVNPLETDMPHQVASLWIFRIFTEEPNSVFFNMTITAVRGGPVVDWPPHPDLYAEKSERILFDADTETRVFGAVQFLVTGEDATWNIPEKVISWGTERLVVEVSVASVDAPQEPSKLFLDYHNASEQPRIRSFDPSMTKVYDNSSNGKDYRFEIVVDDRSMDSPYAPGSRWGFRMLAYFEDIPDPTGEITANGLDGCKACFPYAIKYHMKITAYGKSHEMGM